MAYEYQVYIDGDKEYFTWSTDNDFIYTKRPVKKEFEFSKTLLDFLDLSPDDFYDLTDGVGKYMNGLYKQPAEKRDFAELKQVLDKLAEKHIYFKLLQFDWYDRIKKYSRDGEVDLKEVMWFRDIIDIPLTIITMQQKLNAIFEKVLNDMSPDIPFQAKMINLKNSWNFHFEFTSLKTNFEMVNDNIFTETLHPERFEDIVEFFLRNILKKELQFKVCKSCGKYFPATGHANTEHCDRLFQDTGKTCKEVGSLKMFQKKINENPEFKLYNRAYKTHFARIKYNRMTKEEFQEWAEEAREKRDKVSAGKMSLEKYQEWLKK